MDHENHSGVYYLRAIYATKTQFVFAVTYLIVALIQLGLIWTKMWTECESAILIQTKNRTLIAIEFNFPYTAFNLQTFAMFLWTVLNAGLGVLQFYSGLLALRAINKRFAEPDFIRAYMLSGKTNFGLLLYEFVVFVFLFVSLPSASWVQIVLMFGLGRFWFLHDIYKFRYSLLIQPSAELDQPVQDVVV